MATNGNVQAHVYARCCGEHGMYLQTEFSGTRNECVRYIRELARQGKPTYFLFISTMDIDAATKRHL